MNILDIQWEHGETKLLVERGKLLAVNQTWSQSK